MNEGAKKPLDPEQEEKMTGDDNDTRSISTDDLFEGSNEIQIEHDGQQYRLRITKHRKLILTK